jgi:hypothetical protein
MTSSLHFNTSINFNMIPILNIGVYLSNYVEKVIFPISIISNLNGLVLID